MYLPVSLEEAFGSAVIKDSKVSWRRQVRLNKSHKYKDPFFVTSNNLQDSSQSMNIAAEPIIMAGIARLPHFVYTFSNKNDQITAQLRLGCHSQFKYES